MSRYEKIIYMILHLIIMFALLFALMIYTSLNKSVPWYQSFGIQFLYILILCTPILLVAGIALQVLNTKYRMQKKDVMLPFYAAAGIALPLLMDETLSEWTIFIGTTFCLLALILTIVFIFYHFRRKKNSF